MQHGYIVGIAMMLPTHEFIQIRSEHVLVYPFQGSCKIRVPYESFKKKKLSVLKLPPHNLLG